MFKLFKSRSDDKIESLMAQVESRREQWRLEKLHEDAIRDTERDEAQDLYKILQPNPEGDVIELMNMLKKLEANDNCDTTHRLYLTGAQFDNESFEVKNTYRFCVRCRRFYNKNVMKTCYCGVIK